MAFTLICVGLLVAGVLLIREQCRRWIRAEGAWPFRYRVQLEACTPRRRASRMARLVSRRDGQCAVAVKGPQLLVRASRPVEEPELRRLAQDAGCRIDRIY